MSASRWHQDWRPERPALNISITVDEQKWNWNYVTYNKTFIILNEYYISNTLASPESSPLDHNEAMLSQKTPDNVLTVRSI